MKKIILILTCTLCVASVAYSQTPTAKIWDARFGGSLMDYLISINETSDGGFILGGYSWSGISGEKSEANWDSTGAASDYWVVKIDSMGQLEWERTIGGKSGDRFGYACETYDGGYMIAGGSPSTISGNKTQAPVGGWDFWVVKTDAGGTILWDKVYGGTLGEELTNFVQTPDSGFLFAGVSESGISGDKTQPSQGSGDYWIIKTDALGNKQWDKTFGGTSMDLLRDVSMCPDGGFVLGGISSSPVSGDKTQPNWDPSGLTADFWIVKIDSAGNKLWDRSLGGLDQDYFFSVESMPDGGIIAGGYSLSQAGGDKSLPNWGNSDFWLIKIDSLGNTLWDRNFGGVDAEDDAGNISRAGGNGFLVAGTSYSNISGNKSESNLGSEQIWAVHADENGNPVWDKTIFTPGHDEFGLAIETREGCYAFAGQTSAPAGGYKTLPGHGGEDYWIVKLCDSTLLPAAAATAGQYVCPGSCISFLNQSANASVYQWIFSGANPDTSTIESPVNICYFNPGIYDVTLIATGMNGSDTLTLTNFITVYPSPNPQSITQNGDTLFALAGVAAYQWYYNGNIINGATNYFHVAMQSGNYNVVATDINGCEVEAAINNVIAGLTPLSNLTGVRVFPNPVGEMLSVIGYELYGTAANVSIYNVLGEKINLAIDCCPLTVDCRPLHSGIYIIELISGHFQKGVAGFHGPSNIEKYSGFQTGILANGVNKNQRQDAGIKS